MACWALSLFVSPKPSEHSTRIGGVPMGFESGPAYRTALDGCCSVNVVVIVVEANTSRELHDSRAFGIDTLRSWGAKQELSIRGTYTAARLVNA